MEVQRLNPPSLPVPLAPYCQVVRKGNIVTTAGMIALDAAGRVVGEGDVAAQTRQTLENLRLALEAAGATLRDVVKVTIFLSDVSHFPAMNAAYAEYFSQHPPARATVRADLMRSLLLVEIEALAVLDGS